MSRKTGKIRISAHIAHFSEGHEGNLEDILRSISEKATKWSERVSERPNQKRSVISNFKTHPSNSSIGATFSLYESGSGKSTVVFGSDDGLGFDHIDPPEGQEFLDANIYLVASGNDIVIANIGNRSNIVSNTISGVASGLGITSPTTQLCIFDLPSESVLEKIRRHGVKRVILNAAPMIATAGALNGSGVMARIFGATNSARAISKRRNHAMKLEVWNTSRHKKTLNILEEIPRDEWLDDIAESAMSDGDVTKFTIELNGGERLFSDKIIQSKNIVVSKQGGVFDIEEAHEEMLNFLASIREG